VIATGDVFTTSHIALTGAVTGVLAGLAAAWLLRDEQRTIDVVLIGVLSAAAVFLLRKSANWPQLNDDGLQGFSANDWLAPALVFVVLGLYRAARAPTEGRQFDRAAAAATVIAFVVNVVTI